MLVSTIDIYERKTDHVFDIVIVGAALYGDII